MGQEGGEKWTAAVDLQPTIPKSDRLLSLRIPLRPVVRPAFVVIRTNAAQDRVFVHRDGD